MTASRGCKIDAALKDQTKGHWCSGMECLATLPPDILCEVENNPNKLVDWLTQLTACSIWPWKKHRKREMNYEKNCSVLLSETVTLLLGLPASEEPASQSYSLGPKMKPRLLIVKHGLRVKSNSEVWRYGHIP